MDELDSLQPYFPEGVSVNDTEKINELYEVFKRDLIDNTLLIDDEPLNVKPYPYRNSKKDILPEDFERYNEKFVHVISRTIKAGRSKNSRMVREFREERANRVHWIRPILENRNDQRITDFKFIESDGAIREYYWYRKKQYMVIIEYIHPDYALITGFMVDGENQNYYQNKYIHRVME